MNNRLCSCLFPFTAVLMMTLSIPAGGQTPPDFSNISDILQGARYFVRDDDLLVVQRQQTPSGPQQVFLTTMQTANGGLSGGGGTLLANQVDNSALLQGYSSSIASGRLFSVSRDFGVVLAQSTFGLSPTVFWELTVTDSSVTTTSVIMRQSLGGSGPTQSTAAQVVTGDFTGDGFADVLAFYANVSASGASVQTYMSAVTAQDVTTPASGLRSGAALATPNTWLVGSAAAGDFNGDGRAEVALLDSLGNLVICTVDPKTLQIAQSTVVKLPVTLTTGLVVAGRYRTTPNKEIAVVGVQEVNGVGLAVIIPISFAAGTLNPSVLPPVTVLNTYAGVDRVPGIAPLFAAVGPLQDASTDIDQLVVGFTSQGSGLLDVFTFDEASLTPTAAGIQEFGTSVGGLYGVAVGNFDPRDGSGNLVQELQIAALIKDGLIIFDVDPSQRPFWLLAPYFLDAPGGVGNLLVAGSSDTQGRSLILGAPEKVVVYGVAQPDVILGIPPSHVDWINPINALDAGTYPGCDSPPSPCLLNFTVRPSVPPLQGKAFATLFDFTDTSSTQSNRQSTTSWGVGGKVTAQGKVTYGDCELENCGSVEVTTSASASYDNKVKSINSQYTAATDTLAVTTGFSDFVFYTQQRMNYFYYPVIGQTTCPATKPNCATNERVPMVVVYSAPDQIYHLAIDGSTQEWYQPAHEPGNVLSYPWAGSSQDSLGLLQQQFADLDLDTQTDPIPNWRGTDTSTSDYTKTWAQSATTGSTTGSTVSQTFDASVTTSGEVGAPLGGEAEGSITVDVNQSFSMKKLNMTSSTLSSSTGITAQKPAFDGTVMVNYLYDYAAVIFGLKNPADQQPSQDIDLGVDLQTSGPLVVGFMADVTAENAPGWRQVYGARADVGVQHPQRWNWTQSTQKVAFNAFDLTHDPLTAPIDQAFYHMKGFFITPLAANGQGPNRTVAAPGDVLNLQVRVYNYSLLDTNLAGAARVRVRVFGHLYDNNNDKLILDSFVIGDTALASIPGYNSNSNQGTKPNWALASVPFDTGAFEQTKVGNVYLAFWVVVWMEDVNGNLIPEIQDHGLTASPAAMTLTSITGAPFEAYSNNVGIYGYSSPLFICPAALPCMTSPNPTGIVARGGERVARNLVAVDEVSAPSAPVVIGDAVRVTARLRTDTAHGPLTIAYYDGHPSQGGKLFHVHHIRIRANDSYLSKATYRPQTCGVHTLHVMSRPGSAAPEELGTTTVHVLADPLPHVQDLIVDTANLAMRGSDRLHLTNLLREAERLLVTARDVEFALVLLAHYRGEIESMRSNMILAAQADSLLAKVDLAASCAGVGVPALVAR